MKKNYKTKNKILLFFSAVFIILTIIFSSYAVSKTVMTKGAINYLQDKYQMNEEQIDIIDYEIGMYHLDSTDMFFNWFEIRWYPYKWQFNYNGREFFVNRINGRYYDDYQLDDIQLWATEWLAKKINNNIIGIRFDSEILFNYQMHYSNKMIFTKDNAIDLFNDACTYDYADGSIEYNVAIFIKESYFETFLENDKKTLLNTVKRKLPNSKIQYVVGADKNKIIKERNKFIYWTSEYCELYE